MITMNIENNRHGVDISATITITNEADSAQATMGFVKALLLEGYGLEGIRGGIVDTVEELAESIKTSYKIYNERTGETVDDL